MKKLLLFVSIFFLGSAKILALETVKFSKCVDGDTIKVIIDDKEYVVRMLAIDTPESVKQDSEIEYYGKEASEYTCKKVTNAKKITLEYDDKSDKFDKYDRLLAWVYADGNLLQSDLVEHGYAKVAYIYNKYKYVDILNEKQEMAKAKEIGIWDNEAKEKFLNQENDIQNDYMNIEIIILTIVFLLLAFISNKVITKKHR